MGALGRVRLAIVVIALGLAVFWCWYPVSYAIRDGGYSKSTPEALANADCNTSNVFHLSWAVQDYAECGGYRTAQEYLKSQFPALRRLAAETTEQRRKDATERALRDLAPAFRRLALIVAAAVAAIILAPLLRIARAPRTS
jgi:hypothetical protein